VAAEQKTLPASEQDPGARAAWLTEAAPLAPGDLVGSDETRLPTRLTRRSARAPGGQRARGSVPRHHGTGTPLLAALTTTGRTAALTLPGALDTPAFLVSVREVLCPTRRPGQVVLLDNLSVHQAAAAERLIAAAGCRVLFLPPDSPDFSPSEPAFSQVTAFLRLVAARTQDTLDEAITAALDIVTAADAGAYFRHSGYRSAAQPL
jgi:hypothetical protein